MISIVRMCFNFGFLLWVVIENVIVISSVGANKQHEHEHVDGVGVLSVKYKYAYCGEASLSLLKAKAHDTQRLNLLAGDVVDLPLGGTGRPDSLGLYYAKIGIGTPSKDYYLQVDTGSDITWVNCIHCTQCPSTSTLGIHLTLYNILESSSATLVPCDQQFCKHINGGLLSGKCTPNASCLYQQIYADGSSTAGYFVKDVVQYDQVSGDLQTASTNATVIFGCGARQSGDLSSSNEALDGLLGFGKANSSFISQLASSGKVKKMFAHCLNGANGGGIFAIGHVVQPKVNVTPLLLDQYAFVQQTFE